MMLFEYINQGGWIMYLLLLINIAGISILFWRTFVILDFKKNLVDKVVLIKKSFNELGPFKDSTIATTVLKDEISSNVQALEYGLNTIKIIASIAPLLGLLGTVLGILSAFEVISNMGMSDPSKFAGGIATALITTVGGLIVSIPHYVGYNYLVGVLDGLESSLEKQLISSVFKE